MANHRRYIVGQIVPAVNFEIQRAGITERAHSTAVVFGVEKIVKINIEVFTCIAHHKVELEGHYDRSKNHDGFIFRSQDKSVVTNQYPKAYVDQISDVGNFTFQKVTYDDKLTVVNTEEFFDLFKFLQGLLQFINRRTKIARNNADVPYYKCDTLIEMRKLYIDTVKQYQNKTGRTIHVKPLNFRGKRLKGHWFVTSNMDHVNLGSFLQEPMTIVTR